MDERPMLCQQHRNSSYFRMVLSIAADPQRIRSGNLWLVYVCPVAKFIMEVCSVQRCIIRLHNCNTVNPSYFKYNRAIGEFHEYGVIGVTV